MDLLITCKLDYQPILARELLLYNFQLKTHSDCWINCQLNLKNNSIQKLPQLCFAQTILISPIKINASSINETARKISDFFLDSINGKYIRNYLPVLFLHADTENLAHRVKSIESNWHKIIAKKISRLSKLVKKPAAFTPEPIEGFFVYFSDFNQAFIAYSAIIGAYQRMHLDKNAPSRSYLKVEEAYNLLGCQPKENEKIVDLGAAPGGWTYSALLHKAKVIAVDNARLGKIVVNHCNVTQIKQDALKFNPGKKLNADWLFCDIIEKPDIILRVIHRWLKSGWCNKFIINLKIGYCDPINIINKINHPDTGLIGYCSLLKIHQLYHDRQEITLVGRHLQQQD